MHRRKHYLIYPPNYRPGTDRFHRAHSRLQATKLARKLGAGSEIDVYVQRHPGKRKQWIGSWCVRSYLIELRA